MTIIVVIDLITFLVAIFGIISTLKQRRKIKYTSFAFLKIIFLFFFAIYCAFLFIDWAGLSKELNDFEDLSGAILPVLWIIIFYLLIEEAKVEQVKESEENWRITFRSIGDAIITTDIDGKVTRMNPTAEMLTGWSLDSAIGQDLTVVFKIINAHTRKEVQNPVDEVMKTGNVTGLANHTVLVGKDKNEYQISDSAAPIKDSEGNILGAVLVFSDITEKYKLEQKIIKDQERFELVVKGANIGIWDWDIKSGEVLYNENWSTMLGYSPIEIEPSYSAWEKRVHPDDYPSIVEKLNQHLEGQSPTYEIEHRMLTKDNKWKWILSRGRVMERDSKGKPLRALGTHLDITELKHAEFVLRESENNLRKIFDALSDAVFLYPYSENGDSRFESVNNTACVRYGYEREELLTLSMGNITEHDSPYLLSKQKNIVDVKNTGRYIYESYHISRTGRTFPVEINSSIIEHKGNLMILAVARDISERKKMEQFLKQSNEKYLKINNELTESLEKIKDINAELEEAKEKAEESDQLKTAFLANLSHEVRTPMNGIIGLSDLLVQGEVSKKNEKEYIHAINQSSKRMLRLIEDLVHISKIETNTIEIREEVFSINEVISELHLLFRPQAEQKGLILTMNKGLDEVQSKVVADKGKLAQILTNLLHNALKFTNQGSIDFGYKLRNEELYFWVKDTGLGVPKNKQLVIFERFKRAENKIYDNIDGIGLGLSISKAFVELMGGKINIESEEENGATFWFTLPYNPVS